MDTDRRVQARKATEGFTFIQAEGDDGGRVLNVSEGGLCFETFSPISQAEPIRLWFSFDLRERIEALGKIVWTDVTNRVVGLRFIGLSQAAQDHICKWMNEDSASDAPINGAETAVVRPVDASEVPASEQNPGGTSSRPNPPATDTVVGLGSASSHEQATSYYFPATELVPRERHLSAIRWRFNVGIVVGVLVTSGIALTVFHFQSPRRDRALAQGTVVQKKPEETGAPAASNVSSANSDKMSPFSSIPLGQRKSRQVMSRAYTSGTSFPPSVGEHHAQLSGSNSGPSIAASGGTLGGQTPEAISADNLRRAKKSSATPEQLWASVQAGNASAAVALADLYLRGDGVTANCDQARVLLLVASAKKNPQAIQKLRDLDKTGCPTPETSR
jgi:TPR repeat protein